MGHWFHVRYQEVPEYSSCESWTFVDESWDTIAEAERVLVELRSKGCYAQIVLCTPVRGMSDGKVTQCDC